MRISKEVVADIKLLKKSGNYTGSMQDVIGIMVRQELKKTHVLTKDGYVGVGAVVEGPTGKALVITAIDEDKVSFRDGSSLVNGGVVSLGLVWLADNVESYDGGFFDA